jgi:polysaccharide export outer membrane protein
MGMLVVFLALAGLPSSFGIEKPAVAPSQGPLLQSGIPETEDTYLLQKGDRIKVTIYPQDEYLKGGEMEVSSEGNITLPLVGKISIAGKNVIEAEKAIARVIDADFLVDPEVVIEVLRHKENSIVVLGQVKKPGTYTFPEGGARMTLLQAIALAGGFSDIANIKRIKIVRRVEGRKSKVIHANADAIISGKDTDVELASGDVVHVMESLF